MGFKDLFINKNEQETRVPETTKFPSTDFNTPIQPQAQTRVFSQNNEHSTTFEKMYEDEFTKLNQNGYDFFEFFKAIVTSGGLDNPQMYLMAMNMGLAMDKSTTKDKLIKQAEFYLQELEKVYQHYSQTGTNKMSELTAQKESENVLLNDELTNLRSQQEAISNQIKSVEMKISMIDSKYNPLIEEITLKLTANELAKNNLINTISKVKSGINNNVK